MRDLTFDTHIFKEGDTYVAYAPAFDVSTCGATDEEARRNIRDAVRGFLAASAAMGALEEILEEAGYSPGTSHTKSIPQQFNEIGGKFANAKFAFAFLPRRRNLWVTDTL